MSEGDSYDGKFAFKIDDDADSSNGSKIIIPLGDMDSDSNHEQQEEQKEQPMIQQQEEPNQPLNDESDNDSDAKVIISLDFDESDDAENASQNQSQKSLKQEAKPLNPSPQELQKLESQNIPTSPQSHPPTPVPIPARPRIVEPPIESFTPEDPKESDLKEEMGVRENLSNVKEESKDANDSSSDKNLEFKIILDDDDEPIVLDVGSSSSHKSESELSLKIKKGSESNKSQRSNQRNGEVLEDLGKPEVNQDAQSDHGVIRINMDAFANLDDEVLSKPEEPPIEPMSQVQPEEEDEGEEELKFTFNLNLEDEPEEEKYVPSKPDRTMSFADSSPSKTKKKAKKEKKPKADKSENTEKKEKKAKKKKKTKESEQLDSPEAMKICIVNDEAPLTIQIDTSNFDSNQNESVVRPNLQGSTEPPIIQSQNVAEEDNDSDLNLKFEMDIGDDDNAQDKDNNSDGSNKIQLDLGALEGSDDEHVEGGKITIPLHGFDDDDELKEVAKPVQDDEDSDGVIAIPFPTILEEPEENNDNSHTVFKIPTSDLYDDTVAKSQKARKREQKEQKKTNDSTSLKIDISLIEETKAEPEVIKASIRNFYKLDTQKVTMHFQLRDPSKPETEENTTRVKAQTIIMFNRNIEKEEDKNTTRELKLDLHSKFLSIKGVSLARRYKKKDENMKVTETLHERKDPLEYKYAASKHNEFIEKSTINESYQKRSRLESASDIDDTFKARPCIQEYDEYYRSHFVYEKKKGVLSLEKCMVLNPGEVFPDNFDIIIDYEIEDILDYGLTYRKTNEPSGKGCYLATTHRYFESHYWVPCLDSLKQKNKWKITIVTDKDDSVACSGTLEKVIEIEDSENLAYLYRVDHLTSACKIGFFIGRKFYEVESRYFSNERKMDDFKKYLLANKIVFDITETYEQVLGKYFPYENIDLVFVPNLFVGDKLKRKAICYAGICFLDENIIFDESIIDKRYDSYFHIAYAIATNYFGCYIQEEAPTDFWLVEGISQALANLYTTLR